MEARAQFALATGQQFPQVQELFATANAVGVPKALAAPLALDRNFLGYQVGFDAAWELDLWGKYRRGVESQAAALLGSVADYYGSLVSLTAEVARAYVTIRTFEELLEQAADNVKIQEEGLRIAESRFHNGATSELDVTQATSLLESTRASIPQLEISLHQTRNALSTLLAQPTGKLEALLTGPKGVPSAQAKVGLSIPASLLRRRPDIRSAEYYAAAQCALIGVAKSELYPSFSLVGTIGLGAISSGSGSHNPFTWDSLFYAAGPQVNWPFFSYGRLENGVRVQDARFEQLVVGYRQTVLKAAQEVEDALVGFLRSQDAVTSQEAAEKASERSVHIAIAAYQEGAVDYVRVLDSQRSLLQEQTALTQTRSAVATNLIALYKALGGGWEVSQSRPVIPDPVKEEMRARTNWGDLLTEPRSPEVRESPPPGKR